MEVVGLLGFVGKYLIARLVANAVISESKKIINKVGEMKGNVSTNKF